MENSILIEIKTEEFLKRTCDTGLIILLILKKAFEKSKTINFETLPSELDIRNTSYFHGYIAALHSAKIFEFKNANSIHFGTIDWEITYLHPELVIAINEESIKSLLSKRKRQGANEIKNNEIKEAFLKECEINDVELSRKFEKIKSYFN